MSTSIGFGGNEVIEVDAPLAEVRQKLQAARRERAMVEFLAQNGEPVIVNPEQVKVLQNSGEPETFPPDDDQS